MVKVNLTEEEYLQGAQAALAPYGELKVNTFAWTYMPCVLSYSRVIITLIMHMLVSVSMCPSLFLQSRYLRIYGGRALAPVCSHVHMHTHTYLGLYVQFVGRERDMSNIVHLSLPSYATNILSTTGLGHL